MTVIATASTNVPNGSPTRWAITSAWWTAAITAPMSPMPHSTASNASTPAMPAATSRANDNVGISQVQVGMIHPHSNRRDSPLAEG